MEMIFSALDLMEFHILSLVKEIVDGDGNFFHRDSFFSMHTDIVMISFSCHYLAAIVSGGKGTAQDKIKTLRDAGVTVVESPAKIGAAMLNVFKERGLVN